MRNDYAYVSMRKFEKVVDCWLSAHWKPFQDGKMTFADDFELQKSGIDISCSTGLLIDSKIKNTHNLNEIFGYPSVEITIKDNQLSGWFINPQTRTHFYNYMSVFTNANSYQDVAFDNIVGLDLMLFSKKELKDYIEKYYPLDRIYSDALQLNEFNDRLDYYDGNGRKVFHLKYSVKERAVCLVLKRDRYLELEHTKHIELGETK